MFILNIYQFFTFIICTESDMFYNLFLWKIVRDPSIFEIILPSPYRNKLLKVINCPVLKLFPSSIEDFQNMKDHFLQTLTPTFIWL